MGGIIVGFGEVMGRLEPKGYQRLRQAAPGDLHLTFAGAECNVCASIQMMGRQTRFITALTENALGDACLDSIRRFGIDTSGIIRADGRLGLYFLESGVNQRPGRVLYDRENSVVAGTPAESYDWDRILEDAAWLHVSGITPAISEMAADAVLTAVREARSAGVTVSCDLNFRNRLWRWESGVSPRDLAERTMRGILPFVDVLIGNEEDAQQVLGIAAGETDAELGRLAIRSYPDVARSIVDQFPGVRLVALTLRESLSASHNNWGAMLFEAATGRSFFAPETDGEYRPYEIRNIVDRVGGGDSFAAGLIYALNDERLRADLRTVIRYAVAASCLCHSIEGDFNYSTREEVESLMWGGGSGRVQR